MVAAAAPMAMGIESDRAGPRRSSVVVSADLSPPSNVARRRGGRSRYFRDADPRASPPHFSSSSSLFFAAAIPSSVVFRAAAPLLSASAALFFRASSARSSSSAGLPRRRAAPLRLRGALLPGL